MSAQHWSDALVHLGACSDAVEWTRTRRSYADAWRYCPRADWLLWLAGRLCGEIGSSEHRAVVLAACACARTALRHVPRGERRPLRCIQTTERWARGKATIKEVRKARSYTYAYAATAVYASTAVYAVYAADAAAVYAVYAADAADAAAAAADAAAADDDDGETALRAMAAIVRGKVERPALPKVTTVGDRLLRCSQQRRPGCRELG